jgi:hypothetical protein
MSISEQFQDRPRSGVPCLPKRLAERRDDRIEGWKPFRSREVSSPRPLNSPSLSEKVTERQEPLANPIFLERLETSTTTGLHRRETEAKGHAGPKGTPTGGGRISRGMPDQWRRPLTISARCIRLHPAPHECVDRKETQHIHAQQRQQHSAHIQ